MTNSARLVKKHNKICLVVLLLSFLIVNVNAVHEKNLAEVAPKDQGKNTKPKTASAKAGVAKPKSGVVKQAKSSKKPVAKSHKAAKPSKTAVKPSKKTNKKSTKKPVGSSKPKPAKSAIKGGKKQVPSGKKSVKPAKKVVVKPLLPEIIPVESLNLTIVDPDETRHKNLTNQLNILQQKLHKAKEAVKSMKDELFVEAIQDQLEDMLKKVKYDGDVVTKMKKAPIPKGSAQKGEMEQQVRTKKNSSMKIKKYLQHRDVIPKRIKMNLGNKIQPKSKLNNASRFNVLMENNSPFKKHPKLTLTQAKRAVSENHPKLVLVSVARASPLTDM
jgi:hypothetical protein